MYTMSELQEGIIKYLEIWHMKEFENVINILLNDPSMYVQRYLTSNCTSGWNSQSSPIYRKISCTMMGYSL